MAGGGVCGSRHQLEFDHIEPRALGGATTAENGRLLCEPHNDLSARRRLGSALMDRYTRGLGR